MTKLKLGAVTTAFTLALMNAPALVSAQTSAPATTPVPPAGSTMGDEMMGKGMSRGMGEMQSDPAMRPDAASPPMAKKGCCMKMGSTKRGTTAKPIHKVHPSSAMKSPTSRAAQPGTTQTKDEGS